MRRTLPPSAEIENQIDRLLAVGVGENPRESLSELAKLGARLIIQRAVEDEFDAWLGRARYERRPDYQRGLRNFDSGLRNGYRPRRVQTAEGELKVEIPQVREAAEPFVSKLFAHATKLLRTQPLEAMVVGAFVGGLSMRDVESVCEEAGLGKLSKSTASRICSDLRERFEAFKRRDLYEIKLVALFLDAIYLAVRPQGPKEGVPCAWGFTEEGERVLVGVCLGMRESHEDWLELGRDLIARGLPAPMLVVADGAPGLLKAVEQCWPHSDRQHCCVHRARNLIAKLPEAERERVRRAYWKALDEAKDERDGTQRLQALVDELERAGYASAARCLADDLEMLFWYREPPTPTLAVEAVTDPDLRRALHAVQDLGFVVAAGRLDYDLPVTRFLVVALHDREVAYGLGCHPHPRAALRHAVGELHARLASVGQASDPELTHLSLRDVRAPADHYALYHRGPLHEVLRDHLGRVLSAGDETPEADALAAGPREAHVPSTETESLLRGVLTALAARGYRAYARDLTPPAVGACGVHVVRVLVPGLVPLHFGLDRIRLGCRRLTGPGAPGRLSTLLPHFIA